MGLENLIAGACLSKTFACAGGMQIAMPATAQFAPRRSRQTALAMIFKLAEAAEKAGVASMATTSCRKLSSV